MHIRRVAIRNFKCLREVSAPVGAFGCVVGENNAGKSTLMRALQFAVEGGRLSDDFFYDQTEPIIVEIELDEIGPRDIARLGEPEHQRRLAQLLNDQCLTLRRTVESPGASADLLVGAREPRDARLHRSTLKEVLKGTRGAGVKEAIQAHVPELSYLFNDVVKQGEVLDAVQGYVDGLSATELEMRFQKLPTGLPTSIQNLLPDVVYIEAVKDANSEMRTTDSTTFGKLLGLLLRGIESTEQMRTIREAMRQLTRLTNIVVEDGERTDNRLDEVKLVEGLVQSALSESFPGIGVRITVPEPELKKIFASAGILLDDGVEGPVDSKGDGLKRSVIFALIRAYVGFRALQRDTEAEETEESGDDQSPAPTPLLFLFEEPELYLHPRGQRILFDALRAISDEHQVLTTTHSPLFLSPGGDASFYKIVKEDQDDGPPVGVLRSVNLLDELGMRDAYQLICFENNAAGFFARKVLLVEGPSDVTFFRHVGRVLGGSWDLDALNVPVLPMHSKSNYQKYRRFLSEFDVEVHCVLDADGLLDGVPGLYDLPGVSSPRDELLGRMDQLALDLGLHRGPSRNRIREIVRSRNFRERYARLKQLASAVAGGNEWTEDERLEFDLLFERESYSTRRLVLDGNWRDISELEPVLAALRGHHVYVLRKGAVEDYYPEGAEGGDKPSKAIAATKLLSTETSIRAVFPMVDGPGGPVSELDLIMEAVMGERRST